MFVLRYTLQVGTVDFVVRIIKHTGLHSLKNTAGILILVTEKLTRGQSNLTKSASRGAYSPVRGQPRGSKFVPLNSWGRGSY